MTRAQPDLHNFQIQLEQPSSDLTTQPLLNDSPALFLQPFDTSEPNEPTEHTTSSKVHTPPDNSHETPLPSKERYEIIKDPVFLSSSIYPPILSTNPSRSTHRDDHLIPLLSQDNFTFKAQLFSFYMHPTDYTFHLYDKNQDFFTSIASKIMPPCQYWLDNGVQIFSLQFNFLRPSIYDLIFPF